MADHARLLVVDDEPKICDLFQAIFKSDEYEVETRRNGNEALRNLRNTPYDLVITDIKMPGMDGFELVRRIKELDHGLPVIIITGYATVDTAVRALREGADDYLTKPFSIAEVRRVVAEVLEQGQRRSEQNEMLSQLEEANEELRHHREKLVEKVQAAGEELQRANETLRRRSNGLEVLKEAGSAASELDLESLLHTCVNLVSEKLAVARVSVMLRKGDWLVVKACEKERSHLVGHRRRVGEGIAGAVAQSGEPVLVEDIREDPRFHQHEDWGYATRSVVCVPLMYNTEILGVISATDKRTGGTFGQDDLAVLSTLASQVAPAIENARLYAELEESAFSTVRALVAGLEAKDAYLSGHARRVTNYSTAIGKTLGLDGEELSTLQRAAQLHDVGKLGVPDDILRKPAALTASEYEIIKQHPAVGAQIVSPLTFLSDVRPVIRDHHERPDGRGYPAGLSGQEIHPLARIISVADALDAMTSPRPYRPAKPLNEARAEVLSLAGEQFDRDAAEALRDNDVLYELGWKKDLSRPVNAKKM